MTGPQLSQRERKELIEQYRAWNMSEDDIEKKLNEQPDTPLALVPENVTAFYWFLDVDEFWTWSNGYRVALDIQTILLDANTTERQFSQEDYVKLKLIGRFAVQAQCEQEERADE